VIKLEFKHFWSINTDNVWYKKTEPISFLTVTKDMCKIIPFIILLYAPSVQGQKKILFIGNTSQICCDNDSSNVFIIASKPYNFFDYDAVFLFSSAQSILDDSDVEQLLVFLQSGKGLYLGSDNWPLQIESNLVTNLLFSKSTWGDFTEKDAITVDSGMLSKNETISAGSTTVAFPLDYRLKVEAWVNDEPLICSGQFFGGKIIIDGGYSRFYCSVFEKDNQEILEQFIEFLTQH